MKLSKVLCLECSTCTIFLSSSLTVSMMARFLRSSLSESDINAPFMLLFSLVISCMPSTNNLWKRTLLIYPLSPTSFPYINSTKDLYSRGLRSSMSSGVIMKFNSSPHSLHIRCNLNPKNHPMEHLPKSTFLINKAKGMAISFSNSTYKRQLLERSGAYTCRPFLFRKP